MHASGGRPRRSTPEKAVGGRGQIVCIRPSTSGWNWGKTVAVLTPKRADTTSASTDAVVGRDQQVRVQVVGEPGPPSVVLAALHAGAEQNITFP